MKTKKFTNLVEFADWVTENSRKISWRFVDNLTIEYRYYENGESIWDVINKVGR